MVADRKYPLPHGRAALIRFAELLQTGYRISDHIHVHLATVPEHTHSLARTRGAHTLPARNASTGDIRGIRPNRINIP